MEKTKAIGRRMVRGAQGKQAEGVIRGRCPQEPWMGAGLGGRGGAEGQGQLMEPPSSSDISAQPVWAPGLQPSDLLVVSAVKEAQPQVSGGGDEASLGPALWEFSLGWGGG